MQTFLNAIKDYVVEVSFLNPKTKELTTITAYTGTISNNGMVISSNNNDVLIANDEGVKAVDLHATTFIVIGNTSRLQDFKGRTACFWIGGNN